jgi:hypothetical protein
LKIWGKEEGERREGNKGTKTLKEKLKGVKDEDTK